MNVTKLCFVRFMIIIFFGLLGAYIGDLGSYVSLYYFYPHLIVDGDLKYISSINHIIDYIAFAMLLYTPGLAIAWVVRRPLFLNGLAALSLTFVYFLLVFILGRFNFFYGSFGGFVNYLLNIVIATLICILLFSPKWLKR